MIEKKFVVQKHHASHLHYDFRLEKEGVLKSWAVPKEIPTKKGVKRLAVEVKDHNLDFANFEGEIPKNHYGAGKIEIWDNGTYKLKKWEKDKIEFILKGKKLIGEYALIRFKTSGNNKNWLLFKIE